MDFRISQLQGFVTLVDHLHYGKASRALSISQPTLAFRINSLEDNLRVKLFIRTRKGLSLTEAGRGFHSYARTILLATEEARASMDTFRAPCPPLDAPCTILRAVAPTPDLTLVAAKGRLQ